jgi:hypothetical protein
VSGAGSPAAIQIKVEMRMSERSRGRARKSHQGFLPVSWLESGPLRSNFGALSLVCENQMPRTMLGPVQIGSYQWLNCPEGQVAHPLKASRLSHRLTLICLPADRCQTKVVEAFPARHSGGCSRLQGQRECFSGGRGLPREQAQQPHDYSGEERHRTNQAKRVKERLQEGCFARVVGRLFQQAQWMPLEASQRSASMAALQPSPAAETACR